MVMKIRLARFGVKHKPVYNIVLSHARTARNSKPLEVLGTYNPTPQTPTGLDEVEAQNPELRKFKDITLDTARTKYWLGVGAQPSEPVWRLLSLIGLVAPKLANQRFNYKEQSKNSR